MCVTAHRSPTPVSTELRRLRRFGWSIDRTGRRLEGQVGERTRRACAPDPLRLSGAGELARAQERTVPVRGVREFVPNIEKPRGGTTKSTIPSRPEVVL